VTKLVLGATLDDEGVEVPAYGFEVEGFDSLIVDPHVSECGRFEVDPFEAYGVTAEDLANLRTAQRTLAG
jgi:hypothetical protein